MTPETEALLDKARTVPAAARRDLADGFGEGAASRAYYAAFHAVRAALSERGLTAKTHSGTHDLFFLHVVAGGALPRELSRSLQALYSQRQHVDYDALASLDAEHARESTEQAEAIIDAIEALLRTVE